MPPLVLTISFRELESPFTRSWISTCAMFCQSPKTASFSYEIIVGTGIRTWTRLFKLLYMCSIELRSELWAGHGNLRMLTLLRYSVTRLTMYGQELSCIKINMSENGITCSYKISSKYRCVLVAFLSKITNFVRVS